MDYLQQVFQGPIHISAEYSNRILVAFIVLYFVPSIISVSRNMEKFVVLFFANVLVGWTILGWAGCLVWALRGKPRKMQKKKVVYTKRQRRGQCAPGPVMPSISANQPENPVAKPRYQPVEDDDRPAPFAPSNHIHVQLSQKDCTAT